MSLAAKLKLCALCLILCVLAAALFIALLPFLVSHDAIRLRLAHDLSSITGYNVQLREPPQITVFPSFQARLPHVVLTDNSETDAPLMDAEEIIVRMSLWDALRGRARFSETRLIRPHFTISAPFKAGALFAALARSEGTFGSALRETQNQVAETTDKSSKNAAEHDTAPLFFQPFGRILIEDGRLDYPAATADSPNAPTPALTPAKPALKHAPLPAVKPNLLPRAAPPLTDEIRAIQAQIDWPQKSRAARLSATGLWHGASTSLDITADDALLLLSGGQSPLRISFNSAKGGITFTGAAQTSRAADGAAQHDFSARGRLSARSPGIDQTLRWLKIRPSHGAALTTPFIWESALKADSTHAELSNIVLTIGDDTDGDSGRGALDISYADGLPHISGSLAFENLNINLPAPALFAADRPLETANSPAANSPADTAPGMDMPVFNLFGLDLRISGNKAVINGVPIENPAASIQMQKSGLIFDIGTMRIFGGTAQSSLRLKSDKDRIIGIDCRISTNDTNLSALQKALAAFGGMMPPPIKLQGKANLSLTLQAALPDMPAPAPGAKRKTAKTAKGRKKAPLPAAAPAEQGQDADNAAAPSYQQIFVKTIWPYAHGQFNITAAGGSLADFDMPGFISRVKAGQPFSLAAASETAIFKFDRLEGKFTLGNQVFNPLAVFIDFGSHRLELAGQADIGRNSLLINGVFDPIRLSSGQCATVQCLRQSLMPLLQFQAQGAIFAPALFGRSTEQPAKNGASDNRVDILPKAGVLPY